MSKQPLDATRPRLGDVTDFIQYGYTAKSSANENGPRYLRITDIQNDHVNWQAVPRVTIDPENLQRFQLAPGDIVFARSGATVGKSFLITKDPGDAVFASYLIRVRCSRDRLDPRYAAFFFQSEDYWRQIREGASGVGQPNFNGTKLANLRIPLRPLNDQRAIADKLEAILGRSESARTELSRVERLTARYRRALLAAALRGDLTQSWRRSRDRQLQKQRAVSVQSGDAHITNRHQLPATWKWCSVDSVGQVILGRQRSPDNHEGPNMRPYLRAANITWDGLDLSDVKRMNFDDRDFQKFKLKPGDVLINEGSGSADEVGKPAIWNGEIDDCCFQNTLIAVRPTEPMSDYLYFVFLEAVMSGTFVDQTRGVNIHHIGRAGLAKFSIPLPPADERQEIVRHLKIAFTRIEMLVKESLRASKLLDRLDQAIITRAFQGDLLLQYAGKRLSDNVVDAAPVTSAEVPPGKKPRASATKGAA